MKFSIAQAQINTKLGDVKANLEKHLSIIQKTKEEGADLLVFPELSLTGYALQDLAAAVSIKPTNEDPIFKHLLHASNDIDLVIGFVYEDNRHRFYIASAYLSEGEIIHIHNKVYLHTYTLNDEGRFFARGNKVRAFDTKFGHTGILICEDFWHASPPYLLWLDGADALIFVSASAGRGISSKPNFEITGWVEKIIQAYASLFTVYISHTNRVGFEDGINYFGGSILVNPNGNLISKGPYHQESTIISDIDLNQLRRTRARLPLLRDERTSMVQRELNRIVNRTKPNIL